MRSSIRFAAAVAALVVTSSVTAKAQQALPAGVTDAMVAKGKEVYMKQGLCFACHGPEAKGMVGPNLTDDVWLHSKGSFEEIVNQVVVGVTKEQAKTGVPMPAKGGSSISDEEVRAVAAYVWTLSHK